MFLLITSPIEVTLQLEPSGRTMSTFVTAPALPGAPLATASCAGRFDGVQEDEAELSRGRGTDEMEGCDGSPSRLTASFTVANEPCVQLDNNEVAT